MQSIGALTWARRLGSGLGTFWERDPALGSSRIARYKSEILGTTYWSSAHEDDNLAWTTTSDLNVIMLSRKERCWLLQDCPHG